MFLLSIALLGLVTFLGLYYIFSYWSRYGLPHLKPEVPYGNLRAVAERRQSFGVAISELYRKSTEQLLGIYLFFQPAILVRDASLAKQIMTSDFGSFHDRGIYHDEKSFSSNIFSASLKPWKQVRHKLTPNFSTGKLRNMVPTVLDVGKKLESYLAEHADRGEIVELREICTRYVIDIIALVLFGFEMDSINDPDHPFYVVGRELVRNSFSNNLRTAATFICPGILKLTKISSVSPKVSDFMVELVKKQLELREKDGVTRKDFFQSLIDLRHEDRDREALSIVECASNVNLFYIAGSETTGGTIIFTLHELTHNPAVMKQLLAEIDEALERSGGQIDYDVVKGMRYLDVCIKETLRKYPGLPILNRKCTQDYRVPNSKMTIRKGTQLIIPLLAYAMDERYFPEPEKYMPERFFEETKNYDDDAYAPFGDGPRQCIATQMGITVAKVTLVMLLSKFSFEATHGQRIEFAPSSVPLGPKDGIKLKISRRNI
ncbi:hypothetical protein quinque_002069 [Culex quinquefasciatus]